MPLRPFRQGFMAQAHQTQKAKRVCCRRYASQGPWVPSPHDGVGLVHAAGNRHLWDPGRQLGFSDNPALPTCSASSTSPSSSSTSRKAAMAMPLGCTPSACMLRHSCRAVAAACRNDNKVAPPGVGRGKPAVPWRHQRQNPWRAGEIRSRTCVACVLLGSPAASAVDKLSPTPPPVSGPRSLSVCCRPSVCPAGLQAARCRPPRRAAAGSAPSSP